MFPGVLMLESIAQASAILVSLIIDAKASQKNVSLCGRRQGAVQGARRTRGSIDHRRPVGGETTGAMEVLREHFRGRKACMFIRCALYPQAD